MVAYLDEVKNMSMKIKDFKIRQIPKEENRKVDALANLVSTFDFISDRSIPLEFLPDPSIEVAKLVFPIETRSTWMNDITVYLQDGTLPTTSSKLIVYRTYLPNFASSMESSTKHLF